MWKYRSSNHIAHYGIKGQKWGIRRYQNRDGSLTTAGIRRYGVENSRTLESGTRIQNISRDDLSSTSNSYKSKRLYSSYTDYDKTGYVDLMGNWQYGGQGMRNTFLVKKDIKIASERDVVKTLAEMYQDNPDGVTQLMSDAGYDAIFDVYDINKEVSSEPIILINPSESIGNSKAILLSEKDIDDAIDEYEKLLNAE